MATKSLSSSKSTRDHNEIRKWAETRNAVPCEVADTERNGSTGILRFEFPDAPNRNDDRLQEISWDEFFEKFDESQLELLYQEKTADGERSNFNKLIHPESGKKTAKSAKKSSSKTKHHAAYHKDEICPKQIN